MDEDERKTLSDIREYGCHVLHVLGEGDLSPFTYSVGISKTSHAPEIIVVGLKQEIAHSVVNEYNRRVRNGEAIEDGQMHGGFLQGFECLFRDVEKKHYDEYFGWNQWLYGGSAFRVLQLIYPTTSGVWPWQADASEWFRKRQPLLCPPFQ